MPPTTDSWVKVLVTVLVIPFLLLLVGGILTSYFIPSLIEESNRTEALRMARLKKSIDVGDRNKDFTSKVHVLKTRMQTFNKQNVRGKLSLNQTREAQKKFQEKYTEQYLALDEVAWWWYWDLEREAQAFSLLSPKESEAMLKLIKDYGDNVTACVAAIGPLWQHLSSSEYDLSEDSQNKISALEAKMNSDVETLDNQRVLLVKTIATLFAQSQYEPKH